jgi:hypothetical protein
MEIVFDTRDIFWQKVVSERTLHPLTSLHLSAEASHQDL